VRHSKAHLSAICRPSTCRNPLLYLTEYIFKSFLMASDRKTYFLCPHFDYPASSIKLGHIIPSPSDPSNALNLDEVVPTNSLKIFESIKTGYKLELSQLKRGPVGILETYLQVFGFGSDVSHRDNREDLFQFDELATTWFHPDEDYLSKSIQAEGVQRFLEASRFRKPIYMVTGVKVVKGAHSTASKKSRGHIGDVHVDLASFGAPVVVGPGIEVASSWEESRSFEGSSDFVFAFQLNELKVGKTRKLSPYNPRRLLYSDIGLEDAGTAGVRGVIAEDVIDDDEDSSRSVVLYSADTYTKGAFL